jgi:hypothetical protein
MLLYGLEVAVSAREVSKSVGTFGMAEDFTARRVPTIKIQLDRITAIRIQRQPLALR